MWNKERVLFRHIDSMFLTDSTSHRLQNGVSNFFTSGQRATQKCKNSGLKAGLFGAWEY